MARALWLVTMMLLTPGCDDKRDATPPPATAPVTIAPAATQPTTQELLTGKTRLVSPGSAHA